MPLVPIVLEALPRPFAAWALSPDRTVAATLGTDGGLLVWRVGADGTAHLERRIQTPRWPDGSLGRLDAVALSGEGRYASLRRPGGGFDLWAADSGRLVRRVDGSKDESWRSAWTPAGDAVLLETAPERTCLVRLDGRALDLPVAPPWAFSPDGGAVLGAAGKGLALVDLATGRVRRRFAAPAEALPPYAFSPDGRLLASAGEDPAWKGPDIGPGEGAPTESAYVHELKVDVWRVADGKLLRSLPGYSSSDADGARLLFLDPRRLAVPELGQVFDAPTGRAVGRFDPWPRDGATLELAPGSGFRPRAVRFPPAPDLGRNVAASPDGGTIVTPEAGRETRLLVWDAATRRLLRRVAVPSVRNLRSVAFAPDGTLVVEGTPLPPEVETFPPPREARVRVAIRLSPSGDALAPPEAVAPIRGLPRGLNGAFSAPDGSFSIALIRTFSEGGQRFETARLDPSTGERAWTNASLSNPQGPVALAPDGRSFALAWIDGPLRPGMRTTLGVFDAGTGQPRAKTVEGADVWKSAFSRDGTRLFVATSAGIEVRDASTLALLARADEAQDSGDVEIAPLPTGGFAAVRWGRDLRLFDRDARLLATLVSFPGSGWAAWTAEGEASGSPEGLGHLRRVEGDRLVPIAGKG